VLTPPRERPGEQAASDGSRVEIVTANGRRLIVGAGIDVAALVRIVRALEQL
jgi:transposase